MTDSLKKLLESRKAYAHLNVEASVAAQGKDRFDHGLRKYGVTVDRTDLTLLEWLQHRKEELMDAVRYVERSQREIERMGITDLIGA
jgi:hypothetical protein